MKRIPVSVREVDHEVVTVERFVDAEGNTIPGVEVLALIQELTEERDQLKRLLKEARNALRWD